MIKVLTTGRLSTQFYEHFKDNALGIEVRHTDTATQAEVDWADCLASFPLTEALSLRGLSWIHSFGAGVDGFIQRDDLSPTLRLSRTTGKLGTKAGEFCLCHVLNFFQNTFSLYEEMQCSTWRPHAASSISTRTALILGTGSMARGIATLLRACGMKVLGVNTSGGNTHANFDDCLRLQDLRRRAEGIDCVINTLPLHEGTEGLLDEAFFSLFHRSLFINVGRGRTVNTQALGRALDTEQLRYCVLDVFSEEPLPIDSWLWQHPKVFISPHQAAVTDIDDVVPNFLTALDAYATQQNHECFVSRTQAY